MADAADRSLPPGEQAPSSGQRALGSPELSAGPGASLRVPGPDAAAPVKATDSVELAAASPADQIQSEAQEESGVGKAAAPPAVPTRDAPQPQNPPSLGKLAVLAEAQPQPAKSASPTHSLHGGSALQAADSESIDPPQPQPAPPNRQKSRRPSNKSAKSLLPDKPLSEVPIAEGLSAAEAEPAAPAAHSPGRGPQPGSSSSAAEQLQPWRSKPKQASPPAPAPEQLGGQAEGSSDDVAHPQSHQQGQQPQQQEQQQGDQKQPDDSSQSPVGLGAQSLNELGPQPPSDAGPPSPRDLGTQRSSPSDSELGPQPLTELPPQRQPPEPDQRQQQQQEAPSRPQLHSEIVAGEPQRSHELEPKSPLEEQPQPAESQIDPGPQIEVQPEAPCGLELQQLQPGFGWQPEELEAQPQVEIQSQSQSQSQAQPPFGPGPGPQPQSELEPEVQSSSGACLDPQQQQEQAQQQERQSELESQLLRDPQYRSDNQWRIPDQESLSSEQVKTQDSYLPQEGGQERGQEGEQEQGQERGQEGGQEYLPQSSQAEGGQQSAGWDEQAQHTLGHDPDLDPIVGTHLDRAPSLNRGQDLDLEQGQPEAQYGYEYSCRYDQGDQGYDGQELADGDDQLQGAAAEERATVDQAYYASLATAAADAMPGGNGTDGPKADRATDADGTYDYAADGGEAAAQPPSVGSEQQSLYSRQQHGFASRGRVDSASRVNGSYSRGGVLDENGGDGSYSRGMSMANGGGVSRRSTAVAVAASPHQADSEALLALERERFSQQLQMEVRAREELEDMILRIEKHFKAEQAARKKAEELLQAAISAELEAKNRLEDLMKKRREEQRLLEEERNGIKRERNALESMRQDFEAELQAARSEVAKAQEALAASEDRIRAAEAVDRARLESEYQAKINALQDEIGRLRDELAYRTHLMATEMTRWQQQAHLTAAAVMEAKNEVLERKRELDSTKEKMDRLLDKLYIGRERGMELSGAIAAAQSFAQHAGVGPHGASHVGPMGGPMPHMGGGLASMAGMMPPAMLMAHGGGAGGGGGARGPQQQQIALPSVHSPSGFPGGGGGNGGGAHSNIPKLPPVNSRPPALFGDVGGMLGQPLSGVARRSAPGNHMGYDVSGGGYAMPPPGMMAGGMGGGMGMGMGMGMGYAGGGVPPGMPLGMGGIGAGVPPNGVLSAGAGVASPAAGGNPIGGAGSPSTAGDGSADPYAHVQSRFAQAVDPGKKARAVNGKGGPKKQLDRFEESKRDEARLAAMAKRWG